MFRKYLIRSFELLIFWTNTFLHSAIAQQMKIIPMNKISFGITLALATKSNTYNLFTNIH